MTDWMTLIALLTVPVAPLAAAALVTLAPGSSAIRSGALGAPLPALLVAFFVPQGSQVRVPWVLQDALVGLTATGSAFLMSTAAIWLAAGTLVGRRLRRHTARFLGYYLLVMSGNLGLVVAQDLLSFYLYFALMSFAAYGLVVHRGDQRARRAGAAYLFFVLVGDMMIFAALVLIAHEAAGVMTFEGTGAVLASAVYRDTAMLMLLVGFGVKVGTLGVHMVLPVIYRAAPLPAGVVLAGAMVNAGVIAWLRLFPVGAAAMPGWGRVLVVLGAAAALTGAALGIFQRHPRAVLGYSTISQMGIITLTLGAAVMIPDAQGLLAGTAALYAVHHAFAKGALFMGSGLASGLSRGRRRLLVAGLALPALALAGAPFTTGMLAKHTLKKALEPLPSVWADSLHVLLPWLALATALVLARFLWLVWRQGERADRETPPRLAMAAWLVLLALSAVGAWWMDRPHSPGVWSLGTQWQASWPVLLAAGLSAAAVWAHRRGVAPNWRELPAGDVLGPLIRLAAALNRRWQALAFRGIPSLIAALGRRFRRAAGPARLADAPAALEHRLTSWPWAMVGYLVVLLALWLLLMAR